MAPGCPVPQEDQPRCEAQDYKPRLPFSSEEDWLGLDFATVLTAVGKPPQNAPGWASERFRDGAHTHSPGG